VGHRPRRCAVTVLALVALGLFLAVLTLADLLPGAVAP
jgi:hypothetical protein